MEREDLAREIHRRRVFGQSGAPKGQADADALLCANYGVTPTLDDFVNPGMTLKIKDLDGKSVTAIFSETNVFFVSGELIGAVETVVFAGSTELYGWLPTELICQAPELKTSKTEVKYKVEIEFLFPTPKKFQFLPPNLAVPRIWDYRAGGWRTATGHIYDSNAAEKVKHIDEELLG